MFGWLKIRKPKPTATVCAVPKDGLVEGAPHLPEAAGGPGVPLDPEGFPPHPLLSLLPPGSLERMLAGYMRHRNPGETFSAFTRRHDLNNLQQVFTEQ